MGREKQRNSKARKIRGRIERQDLERFVEEFERRENDEYDISIVVVVKTLEYIE